MSNIEATASAFSKVEPVEARPKRVSRRVEVPEFDFDFALRPGSVWELTGVAAGAARLADMPSELIEFANGRGPKRIVTRVVGDSMDDTIRDGERVCLRLLPTPVELPPAGEGDPFCGGHSCARLLGQLSSGKEGEQEPRGCLYVGPGCSRLPYL